MKRKLMKQICGISNVTYLLHIFFIAIFITFSGASASDIQAWVDKLRIVKYA